jgi:hypothetical protein
VVHRQTGRPHDLRTLRVNREHAMVEPLADAPDEVPAEA